MTRPAPADLKGELPGRARLALVLTAAGFILVGASLAILAGRRSHLGPSNPSSFGTPYVIQKGDTAFVIAQRKLSDGNRWKEIKTATGRNLSDADKRNLIPGEILYIPEPPAR